MVWDEFFELHEVCKRTVKYPLNSLTEMNKEEFRNVISEYFFFVYYRFYKDTNGTNISIYDPEILAQLGLPLNADKKDIKKKFHEHAKLYHPDNGGCDKKFIDLMEKYEKFRE